MRDKDWVIMYNYLGKVPCHIYHLMRSEASTEEQAVTRFKSERPDATIIAVGQAYEEPLSEIEGNVLRHLIAGLDNVLGSERLKQVLFDSGGLAYASELRNVLDKVKEVHDL